MRGERRESVFDMDISNILGGEIEIKWEFSQIFFHRIRRGREKRRTVFLVKFQCPLYSCCNRRVTGILID